MPFSDVLGHIHKVWCMKMNRRTERILLGLLIVIVVIVLAHDTSRIQFEAWGIHLDIFTTSVRKPDSAEK